MRDDQAGKPEPGGAGLAGELLARLDLELARGLDEAAARGQVPSCRAGCAHCCHHGVQASAAEAELVVAHVRQHLTPEAQKAAEQRVLEYVDWLAVQERLLGPHAHVAELGDRVSRLGPVCPFLSDHRCQVYAARPLVCRTHYVTGPPEHCLPPERGGPTGQSPRIMHSLCETAAPYFAELHRPALEPGGDAAGAGARGLELLLLPEAYAHAAGLHTR